MAWKSFTVGLSPAISRSKGPGVPEVNDVVKVSSIAKRCSTMRWDDLSITDQGAGSGSCGVPVRSEF